MKQYMLICLFLIFSLAVLTACNMNNPNIVPTPTVLAETFTPIPSETNTATPIIPTNTAPVIPTTTEQPIVATPTLTETLAPPSETPLPTATSGPFEYIIQENDTLMYIIQLPQHGYGYELSVAQQVVDLNDNMSSIDFLPPVGSTILIPQPTSTATPVGAEATQVVLATIGVDNSSGALLASGATVGCYEVQEDDSLVSIAAQYNTTLEILSQLNTDLNWFGCVFSEPSGGPQCNPTIQISQCINVPQPTPVPTYTPTPSGNETSTPTPTYPAPRMLYPTNNTVVPPGQFDLQWIAVTGLTGGDQYLVELTNTTNGQKLLQVTDSTSFTLPDSFVPQDGQTHIIEWRVSVTRQNESGIYGYIGAQGNWRTFEWLSQ